MLLFLSFLGSLIPVASAKSLQELGEGIWGTAPGVSEMWESMTSLFPFTDAGDTGPQVILDKINEVILGVIALVAVGLLVFAGIRMMASGGSEEGLTEARRIIKNVAIGLICAMIADVAIMYIVDLVTKAATGGGGA